jgi:predicted O-methyltransferase YrrM
MNTKGSSLYDTRVRHVLDGMHGEADKVDPPLLAQAQGKEGAERAAFLDHAFIPVSPDAGRLLYTLVRGCQPGATIEFGTSFGISTIYMAAALRDRGEGIVVTTELNTEKAARAEEYIRDAGLLDFGDLSGGDALETLKGLEHNVSMVFLDGWKNLYLPVLHLLEPALRPGALVAADDLDLFPAALKPYLDYVRNPVNGYVSATLPVGDAMELSARSV